MKKTLSIALTMAMAGISSVASAENPMGLEFSADVALTSNYIYRGISQSDDEASIQGGFYFSHSSGIYGGLWGASVDGSNGFLGTADLELDPSLGWGGELGPVGVDVGWVRYGYPDEGNPEIDTDEFHIGISKDFEVLSASATLHYSDDFFNLGDATYFEVGIDVPVSSFTLSAHYGVTDYDDDVLCAGCDYEDWSVGASTELGGFGFSLTYSDTDISTVMAGNDISDDEWAFTISKAL
jgi:uncharacterized protein (TIGR02001 family)